MTVDDMAIAARLESLLADALSSLSDVETPINQAYEISVGCADARVDDNIVRSYEDIERLRRRLERTIDMLSKGKL